MKRKDIQYNEKSVFRLRFISFGTIGALYGHNLKELIDWPYSTFMIPDKMGVEEAFLILSYLVQKIEKDLKLEECSQLAVTVLNEKLPEFYFIPKTEYKGEIVDLYTVAGDMKRFKKSEYNSKYFEWFKDEVQLEEVKGVYEKYGYSFKNPEFSLKE